MITIYYHTIKFNHISAFPSAAVTEQLTTAVTTIKYGGDEVQRPFDVTCRPARVRCV